MWRAALSFGLVALARGCEFALDAGRREAFDLTRHMTVEDVVFIFGGRRRRERAGPDA
jgi:hypothetical protein